jgi:putrescine:ornithine antiporter
VLPYILALSALPVMMKAANVAPGVYTRNMVITVIAMLYSVYALYASGGDAVMGGMLVLGLTYVIWGFISNRFTANAAKA